MTPDQPVQPPPEPPDDAGMEEIRLDADRARMDLEHTLNEIERRLDPQRIIQPVKRGFHSVSGSVTRAFRGNPALFITVTVLGASAIGGLLVWARSTSATEHDSIVQRSVAYNSVPHRASVPLRTGSGSSDKQKPAVATAAGRSAKRAIGMVKKLRP